MTSYTSNDLIDYSFGDVVVREDRTRANEFWSVSVPLVKKQLNWSGAESRVISRHEVTLEIILSGHGLSKARQKVVHYLESQHIPVKTFSIRRE